VGRDRVRAEYQQVNQGHLKSQVLATSSREIQDNVWKNTFPKIKGISSVVTRLLKSCLVGMDMPTPEATNFEMLNGT